MMKRTVQMSGLLLALCVTAAGTWAQTKPADFGQREYLASCATCHGADAKGSGPLRPYLTKSPGDLTVLAKKNGGILPAARMYAVIEGSQEVAGHGSRDMPAWGYNYRLQAAEYYMDVPYNADAFVRAKILALIEYINRVQVK